MRVVIAYRTVDLTQQRDGRQLIPLALEPTGDIGHFLAEGGRRGRLAVGARQHRQLGVLMRQSGDGVADLVEFHPAEWKGAGREVAFPIEYKRGKPKLHRADEVQLCAQALCLEEMTGNPVPEGALFYAETKRRLAVPFDAELRRLTEEVVRDLQAIFDTRVTPPPTTRRERCRACSLVELCRPDTVARPVRAWLSRMLQKLLAEEQAP